jgi:hypothetical protein
MNASNPPPDDPDLTEVPLPKRDGLAPEIWVVGLITVIIILLVLLGLAL